MTVPAAAAGLDLAVAFAPKPGDMASLQAFNALEVPLKSVSAMIRAAGYDEKAVISHMHATVAYDLDRDGKPDLLQIPQVRFGGRIDWVIGIPEGGKLRELFTCAGNWADIQIERGAATLRFHGTMKLDGEPLILWTLYFANGTWAPPIKTYAAAQGKVPAVRPPYGSFEARARVTLRATPVVDDAPAPAPAAPTAASATASADPNRPGWPDPPTTMLRGNVFAAFPAGARGILLASEGPWRYVAFEPSTRPIEAALTESVGSPDAGPQDAWHCGWVAAAELMEQR